MTRTCTTSLLAAAMVLFLPAGMANIAAQNRGADHVLASRPNTVTWGWIPTDQAPVLTIRSGQTVRIDTISHQGSTQAEDPVVFMGRFGVKPDEVLQDVRDFWASRPGRPREGRGGVHVLTGPIAIESAEPGDMLEVQILEVRPRVPYGFNTGGPATGVFTPDYPGARPGDAPFDIPPDTRHMYRTGVVNGREVVFFSDRIHVPFAPFLGTMAVAPAEPRVGQPGVTIPGVQTSTPPGSYGGNMDLKDLTVGSTLYLPVFRKGAMFYTGDPHGAMGNGEVSGNALEQSMTAVLRFVIHKGRPIAGPRAETPTDYILMGIDVDLDRAMRLATAEVIRFLVREKGLTAAQAQSLASIAVDFQVAEAVDQAQLVAAKIPKSLFIK